MKKNMYSDTFEEEIIPKDGSILHELKEARVVSFVVSENELLLREECDEHFRAKLSGEELDRLIAELQELRKQIN